MKNPRTLALHDVGQRLWLDNITRQLLQSGTLARYIRELSVTGLTSNPTIFEHAIATGTHYDESIRVLTAAGLSGETLFFELALEDLTQAAELFRPIFEASQGNSASRRLTCFRCGTGLAVATRWIPRLGYRP
jgi:transaldolase